MKLLILHADRFAYRTRTRTLETGAAEEGCDQVADAIVAFLHAENEDESRQSAVETKVAKNLKWAARKNDTTRIVLHSFAHLSDSRARPEFAQALIGGVQSRLNSAGYTATQTPFGYLLDLDLSVPGRPLARIFKDL